MIVARQAALWVHYLKPVLILPEFVLRHHCRFRSFTQVHGTCELVALLVIALELGMRMKWLGRKAFFRHIRTLIKVGVTKSHVMHKIRKSCNNPDVKEVVHFQVLTSTFSSTYQDTPEII